LLQLYVFALVLGGVLLAASLLAGDHDADADGFDGADGADTAESEALAGAGHGDIGGFAALFASTRFWTFFAASFGLTGLVFEGLGLLASSLLTLAVSLGLGLTIGLGAAWAVRKLTHSEVGRVADAGDYVGKSGRVLLAVERGGRGKLRLELQGTTVDVLAITDDAEPIAAGETALVVEMQGTEAFVTRLSAAGASERNSDN